MWETASPSASVRTRAVPSSVRHSRSSPSRYPTASTGAAGCQATAVTCTLRSPTVAAFVPMGPSRPANDQTMAPPAPEDASRKPSADQDNERGLVGYPDMDMLAPSLI